MRGVQPSGMPELASILSSNAIARREPGSTASPPPPELREELLTRPTPYFFFDVRIARDNLIRAQRAAREKGPAIELAYSVKTNPLEAWVRVVEGTGAVAECISVGEYRLARSCGFPNARIVLNGPAKALREFPSGTRVRAIFFDSIEEINAWMLHATDIGADVIGMRLRLRAFGSRFGIDIGSRSCREALLTALRSLPQDQKLGLSFHISPGAIGHLEWAHCAQSLIEVLDLLHDSVRQSFSLLNLGGGWFPGELESNALPVARELADKARSSGIGSILLEPGRAITQAAGTYVASVVEIRERTKEVLVDAAATDLPDLHSHPHAMWWLGQEASPLGNGNWVVLGRTCMETDVLATHVAVPHNLRSKDKLLISNTGAYDMSLGHFFGMGVLPSDSMVFT